MENTAINITTLFTPLVGQIAWSVRRGHGSFLTMEFGKPHLAVRNPVPSKSALPKVKEDMARRRVFPHGQWHFWVTYADWNASAEGRTCNCNDEHAKVDDVLKFLDGQILKAFHVDNNTFLFVLEFDLGGTLSIALSDIPIGDDAWLLFDYDRGVVASYEKNGRIATEASRLAAPGSIIAYS